MVTLGRFVLDHEKLWMPSLRFSFEVGGQWETTEVFVELSHNKWVPNNGVPFPGPTLRVADALVGNLSPSTYLRGICLTSQKGILSPGVKVRQGQEAKPWMGSQQGKRGEAYSGRKCAVVLVCLWVTAQWGCKCCQTTSRTLTGEMLI